MSETTCGCGRVEWHDADNEPPDAPSPAGWYTSWPVHEYTAAFCYDCGTQLNGNGTVTPMVPAVTTKAVRETALWRMLDQVANIPAGKAEPIDGTDGEAWGLVQVGLLHAEEIDSIPATEDEPELPVWGVTLTDDGRTILAALRAASTVADLTRERDEARRAAEEAVKREVPVCPCDRSCGCDEDDPIEHCRKVRLAAAYASTGGTVPAETPAPSEPAQ